MRAGLSGRGSVWLKRQSPLWHELSKEDKLEACFRCALGTRWQQDSCRNDELFQVPKRSTLSKCLFRHLDYDDSGVLDETEVLALYRQFDPYGAGV